MTEKSILQSKKYIMISEISTKNGQDYKNCDLTCNGKLYLQKLRFKMSRMYTPDLAGYLFSAVDTDKRHSA